MPAPRPIPAPSSQWAPPPPTPYPAREWSASRSLPVTGTRRHKERSKQGARRSPPGPFIKPGPRGRGRRPSTRQSSCAPGLCEWSAATPLVFNSRVLASAAPVLLRTTRGAAMPPGCGIRRKEISSPRIRPNRGQGSVLRFHPFLSLCFPFNGLAGLLPGSGEEGTVARLPGQQGLGPPRSKLTERVQPGRPVVFSKAIPLTLAYALA